MQFYIFLQNSKITVPIQNIFAKIVCNDFHSPLLYGDNKTLVQKWVCVAEKCVNNWVCGEWPSGLM